MSISDYNKPLNKYNSIPFWRVVFTFSIAVFHFSGKFPVFLDVYKCKIGWRIAVEFFFIVSGFLLAYKCRNSEMDAFQYTKHKFWRFLPEYVFMLIFLIPYRIVFLELHRSELVIYLFNLLDDIFFLHGTGIGFVNVNGATWYLSSLMICGYIIYYLYKKYPETFVKFIAPVMVIFSYSVLYKTIHHLSGKFEITSIYVSVALIRGFAGISMGVLAYELYVRVNEIKFTRLGKVICSLIEFGGYAWVLLLTFKKGSTKSDFVCVLVFFICVVLSFSRKEKNILYNNRVINYLSKISYSIYLNHIVIKNMFPLFFDSSEYHLSWLLVYLIVIVVFGAVGNWIPMQAVKVFRKHKKTLIKIFVEE